MLGIDAVGPLAAPGLERFDRVPGLFHRAGHEAADGVGLPSHLFHDLGQGPPFFRWSRATTVAVLLPSRGPAVSGVFAAFLLLSGFLAAVDFLVDLP